MTTRRILLIAALACSQAATTFAQTKLGNNLSVINSRAALELEDTTKGLLIPRMSSANRTAISSPPQGLLVYDSTVHAFYYYQSGSWTVLNSAVSQASNLSDADKDTKVETEKSPDEDRIRFTLAGTEKWVMNGNRLENKNTGGTLALGFNAGANITGNSNTYSTYVGEGAGFFNVSGVYNTVLGNGALFNNTSSGNTVVGKSAAQLSTTGGENVAVGYLAMQSNKTGSGNTAIGAQAMNSDTAGSRNVFIGSYAGYGVNGSDLLYIANNPTTRPLMQGDFSTGRLTVNDSLVSKYYRMSNGAATGYLLQSDSAGNANWISPSVITGAISLIQDADQNTRIQTEKTADENVIRFDLNGTERWTMEGLRLAPKNTGSSVFIGENAGSLDDGNARRNLGLGFSALGNNITGGANVAMGYAALSNNTASNNTAVGYAAGQLNTTGVWNLALGENSLYLNQTSSYNVAVGGQSLLYHTSGDANTAFGMEAMYSHTTGANNVALGAGAGRNNLIGVGNVFIGSNAATNETGSNKLYIENSISSTPLIYGDFAKDSLRINGSFGVAGTGSPNAMTVLKTGYVGINVDTPGAPLTVITKTTSGFGGLIAQMGSSALQGRIQFYDEELLGDLGPKMRFAAGNVAQISGSGAIAVMPSNYFGVNTTTPYSTLTVNGSIGVKRTATINNYTATSSDYLIAVTTSAAVTITLPTASSATTGRTYIIKAETAATPAITIDPVGSGTIDGSLTKTIATPAGSISVYSDGNNWWTF